MKKLLTGALVLAMFLTMAVPVFAEDTVINQNSTDKKGETAVSFNVDPTYTIIIPGTVELEEVNANGTVTYEKDMDITASAGMRLEEGYGIQVTMDSDFVLETGDTTATYTLPYTVTVGESTDAIANEGVVAEFTTSTAAQTSTLHFAAGNPTYAGEYTDTVTFNIRVSAPVTVTPGGDWGSGTVGF